jgi:hypothetical protein
VICSGHGAVTVPVDASGAPVERQVLCPDCVLTLPAPSAPGPVEPSRRIAAAGVVLPPEDRAASRLRPHGVQQARAPPPTV